MDEVIRVIHVVQSLDFGGLERVVLSLARSGRELNQDVSVLCLERPGTLAPQAEALGIPVTCVNKQPGIRWEVVRSIQEVFRQTRPDVIHSHQIGALLYAGPAAKRERVPGILHTRHLGETGKPMSWLRRLRTFALWRYAGGYADRYCCCSQEAVAAAGLFRLVPRKNLFHVPNGIDTAAFEDVAQFRTVIREQLRIPLDSPVIGTVGRMAEVKQQDVLIRAFAELRPLFPTARLVLVGDGPVRAALERLTDSLALTGAVRFAGYQPHPERFLSAMDVFALTSRAEGMPLVILEAWAAGRPVVATRVGAIPWMIADGATGILIDPGNVSGLAGCLAQLLSDRQRAEAMGRTGRQLVRDQYDTAVMAGAYDRHYRDLLATNRGSHSCASSR